MYLIELILKKWIKKKKEKTPVIFDSQEQDENLSQNCEKHIYMPIDSSCDYLACKNCGHIIKNYKKNQTLYDNF